jgi:predicted transglutaminase-like cysteine proteinase
MPHCLPAETGILDLRGNVAGLIGACPRARTVLRSLVCLLCLLMALAVTPPAAAISLGDLIAVTGDSRRGVFGSMERKVDDLQNLPQWTRILHRPSSIEGTLSACLDAEAACTTTTLRRWRAAIAAARDLPRRKQLAAVNDYFNRWPYRSDKEVYGVREYWATPQEFMASSGDCEDYAIAKFFTLRVLGFANDQLRIVALTDRIRRVGHAVVTVRHSGEVLVLDSLSNLILPQDRYKHYVARFSVNETSRWHHSGSFRARDPEVFLRPAALGS